MKLEINTIEKLENSQYGQIKQHILTNGSKKKSQGKLRFT